MSRLTELNEYEWNGRDQDTHMEIPPEDISNERELAQWEKDLISEELSRIEPEDQN